VFVGPVTLRGAAANVAEHTQEVDMGRGTEHRLIRRLGLGLLLLCGSPEAASAGTTTIEYQITGGSVTGGDIVNAPVAATGGWAIRYPAGGPNTLSSGPATLLSVSVVMPPAFTVERYFLDSFQLSLTSAVGGGGTPAAGFSNLAPAAFEGVINAHCFGYCGYYNLVTSVAKDFPLYVTAAAGGLQFQGDVADLSGNFTIPNLPDLGFGRIALTGQEVRRTFVPEPTLAAMLPLAFAAVWLLFVALRRRTAAVPAIGPNTPLSSSEKPRYDDPGEGPPALETVGLG
jgi:hypothetical protein